MWHDLLLAVGFFTRIPVPDHPNFSQKALKRSALYLPLVGLIVGSLCAVVYLVAVQLWSPTIAVLLSMITSLLITGGFHEDGLADTADGLGGAFERDKKLAIMTDSRLGSYGSLAMWSALTLKAVLLIELIPQASVLALILVHGLSRWGAMLAMVRLPYVRLGESKSKPVVQQLRKPRWLFSGLVCLPLLLWVPLTVAGLLLITLLTTTLIWHQILKQQIHGYTGDTLGASQQLNELMLYLAWLAVL
ncbi:MAG: adenosylcobinamide-GDP ribazoletransferase [Reinekea sp.]